MSYSAINEAILVLSMHGVSGQWLHIIDIRIECHDFLNVNNPNVTQRVRPDEGVIREVRGERTRTPVTRQKL